MPANGLSPIMSDAEVMTRSCQFKLCTGEWVTVDPSSKASLDAAEASIVDSAHRMGVDGRVMFTAARRQIGDIIATRASVMTE